MEILVSGGAGFLGSHLIDRLLQRDDISRIVAVDNLWTGTWDNLGHVVDPRLVLVTSAIESFQSEIRFDEAYHFASPASPIWYMSNPRATISANLIGAMRIYDLLQEDGVFCFTSTSEVYGDPSITPQSERYKGLVDCTGPRAAYDESKRCTEAFLFEMRRTAGLRLRVARIFNAYGPRTRDDDGRAISNFVSAALAGKPLLVYGDGTQTRSWGYVDDIVEGLVQFFWGYDGSYPGPLNIGNDREISVLSTARHIASLVPGARIEFAPPAPDDPSNRCPDLKLARTILPSWTCKTGFELGISQTLSWFEKRQRIHGNELNKNKSRNEKENALEVAQ